MKDTTIEVVKRQLMYSRNCVKIIKEGEVKNGGDDPGLFYSNLTHIFSGYVEAFESILQMEGIYPPQRNVPGVDQDRRGE